MIRELLAVGFGGAAGSIARYLLSYSILAGHNIGGLPLGTFAVNTIGSLIIGLVTGFVADSPLQMRLLAIGFCGGFTTFSAFSVDIVRLLREGAYLPAILYMGLTILLCVAFAALGMWIGEILKINLK